MMKTSQWFCAALMTVCTAASAGTCLGAEAPQQTQRNLLLKAENDGNYKDAYEGFRKLALDPNDDPAKVGDDLRHAVEDLQRLNRVDEIDAFREAVIEVHAANWRLLWAAAQNYMDIQHQGFIVAGEFQRGNKRGGKGGKFVNAIERDRVRALQLMVQALPLAMKDENHSAAGNFMLALANMLLNNRGYSEAWRLQYLTDLSVLPDYEPGYGYYRSSDAGTPVDEDGQPVYHQLPKSFDTSTTDGQRWRWCLEQAAELNPSQMNYVRLQFADFLMQQFGVQTMQRYGWAFGRMQVDDTKKDEASTYELHTLGENETIANLATGVKRFELPEEFNFIKIYQSVADSGKSYQAQEALERLAQIFENRRQYPKAAECWRRLLKEKDGNVHQRKNWKQRLDQIVNNWGRFETVQSQPAGQGATVEYRFRNGKQVDFTAHAIKIEQLLADVKAYIRSRPNQLDWQKINIGNIGHQLVYENETKYLGEQVAKWQLDVKPRADHFDARVTVTTPLQKAGAYLVKARLVDGNESFVILWLDDTAIVKKPIDGKTYLFVADAVDGRPIGKAKLDFFGYRQRHVQSRQYEITTKEFAEHTGADGQLTVDAQQAPHDMQWLITATTADGRFAYLGFTGVWYSNRYEAEYRATKAFAITDRPVYRPDQTVHYKFWVRHAQYDKDNTSDFAGKTIGLEIYDPKGERLEQKEIKADTYGGIEGELKLPADATLGTYRIQVGQFYTDADAAKTGLKTIRNFLARGTIVKEPKQQGKRRMRVHYGNGHFRVEEYKKPEFEVTVDAPTEPVMLGEKITATIRAKYYFGSPVTHAKVKYKILRTDLSKTWYAPMPWDWFYGTGYWWFGYDYDWYPGFRIWGCRRPMPIWWPRGHQPPELVAEREVEIGEDGTVKVEIDTAVAKALHPDTDHKYSITAEVVDQSRRTIVGTGDVQVARKPFSVYAWVDRGYYRVGDVIQTNYKAITLDSKPVEGAGKVTLYRIGYRDGKPVETEVASRELPTNSQGAAELKFRASHAGQYRLAYEVTDTKKHTIEGGYVFTIIGEGFDSSDFRFNSLELIPDKREYAPGETVKLQINTDRVGSTVLLFARPSNGVYLPPKVIHLDGKSTVEEIAVVKKDMPNFFVEAVTVADGKVYTESKEIVVPPEKRVLNVDIRPSKEAYKPGEKATVELKLTDFFGEAFEGSAVVAIYDKSVEYISGGSNVGDIREFFWKWRRQHRPRTESNLGKYFTNLIRKGAEGMSNLGVFGATVADDMDTLGRNAMPTSSISRGYGIGGMGGGMPLAKSRRMAAADGMALSEAAAAPAAAPMEVAMDAVKEESEVGADRANAAGESGSMAEPTVRKSFADTALWVGSLTTKKDGTAEVQLDMPENLTTWRIKVWGMGHGTKVGEGTTDVVTRKDFILRLQAPRFFVQTDEVVLSAVVHNYLKTKKTAQVALEVDKKLLEPLDELVKSVEIEAGGEARVNWRVKVLDEGEATIRMKALTDEESDAMEQKFPCYIHGMLKTDSYSGAIRPKDTEGRFTVNVPAERRVEQTRLEVRYSPTLAGAMVDALPYLVDYPYGCTEQTLNRFLPTVITQKILLNMGLNLEEIEKKRTNLNAQEIGDDRQRAEQWQRFDRNPVFDEAEVGKMVKEGVNRLAEMQLSDGGWGWFSGWGEKSYPHTTALVVHGLQIAQQNDVALPGDMLQRGIDWLTRYQDEQVKLLQNGDKIRAAKDDKQREALIKKFKHRRDSCSNEDAFVYMVLVDSCVKNQAMMDYLYRDRTKLAVYGNAMYGIALHKQNEQDKLAMILKNISQFLVEDDENQTAYLKLADGYWWHWYGSEYEAHAYYLKLLALTDPKGEVAPRLVKYLLNNRKHATYWNSTRDTALCIEAMADFLKASGEDRPDMTVELWVDGKLQKAVEITPKNLFMFDNKLVIEGEKLLPGPHTVELKKKGTGPLYYNGYMTNFTLEDFITKAGLEIKVERKYYKLVRVDASVKVSGSRGQALDQKVEKYERVELPNWSTLRSGDLVEIELKIDSKNDYEYLVFEDMKPAGFEAVDVRSGYTGNELGAYVEFRDNRVVFFCRALPRGTSSVSYRMRAEIPGKFSALPTRAAAMYAPELKANSDELKLQVED